MKYLLPLCLLLVGCAPKPTQLPTVAQRGMLTPVAPQPTTNITLVWDYVTNSDYSFNVYAGTNLCLDQFRLITNVPTTYCTLPTDQPHMFFQVKVLDNISLEESDWARK